MENNTKFQIETLEYLKVLRGETQKNVNFTILKYIVDGLKLNKDSKARILDLPCGSMLLLSYLRRLFPKAELFGADIKKIVFPDGIRFHKMDLTKDFSLSNDEQFDLILSVSGVMMFSNTLSFISNCTWRLKKNGTFIITNDNSSTIIDKLSFLLLGRHRIFKPLYEESETLTQNIPIQELCRLLMTNKMKIEKIIYTSFYKKDLIYLPLVILLFPIQWIYIMYYKTTLPSYLKWQMYPLKHYLCKHYIIVAHKV